MKVQKRYAFVGHTLLRQNTNVNWRIGESPLTSALLRREKPEDEVCRRWKGEIHTLAREIGAAQQAPLQTVGFRVPRLNGNYIFRPRGGVVWRKKQSCSRVGNETNSISPCNAQMIRHLGWAAQHPQKRSSKLCRLPISGRVSMTTLPVPTAGSTPIKLLSTGPHRNFAACEGVGEMGSAVTIIEESLFEPGISLGGETELTEWGLR